MMANHEENEWEWEGQKYKCKPGQFITSLKSIAEKAGLGISIQNVRTALTKFEKYGFLTNQSTNKNRLITIVNWDFYQAKEDAVNKPANKQLTSSQQATNKQLTTNKNDKNDKNDKKYINIYPIAPIESATTNDKNVTRSKIKFAEFVSMTNDEYEKLLATYGKEMTAKLIEILDNYKGATGKKYKSDYRAILSWVVEKVRKELPRGKEAPIEKFTNETDKQKIEKYSKLYLS